MHFNLFWVNAFAKNKNVAKFVNELTLNAWHVNQLCSHTAQQRFLSNHETRVALLVVTFSAYKIGEVNLIFAQGRFAEQICTWAHVDAIVMIRQLHDTIYRLIWCSQYYLFVMVLCLLSTFVIITYQRLANGLIIIAFSLLREIFQGK